MDQFDTRTDIQIARDHISELLKKVASLERERDRALTRLAASKRTNASARPERARLRRVAKETSEQARNSGRALERVRARCEVLETALAEALETEENGEPLDPKWCERQRALLTSTR